MRYALKKVRKITIRDIATGKNKVVLADLQTVTFAGNADVVWANGTDGVHLVGFDVNKVATLTGTNGAIDMGYLEMQTGGKLTKVSNGTEYLYSETLDVKDGKAKTTYKASGVVGKEIAYVYPLDGTSDPDRLNAYEQGAEATATVFAYDPATKEITLPTGKFEDGSKVYVEYFPKFTSYEELDNDADKFSESGAVYVDGWFTDICTKKDLPMQIVLPAGKISGEISYQMGDQAAVQSISIEGMTTCGDATLWKLLKVDFTDVSND